MTLTVDEDMKEGQGIVLDRCVGCFRVICSEGIPNSMMAMNYTAEGGGTALNALTGYADATATRKGSINFSSVADRTKAQAVNIYTFLPAEQANMDFTMSAVDGNDVVIRSRTFSNVPMKINTLTSYSGDFFAEPLSSQEFSLSLSNAEWEKKEYTY